MVKRRILLLGLCMLVAGRLAAEKVTAATVLNRNPIGLAEKVYLTIEINYHDVSKVQVTKSIWPAGLALLSGPTIRNFYDAEDTDNPRKIRIYYAFRGDRVGRIIVDPIGISAGDSEIETEPFVVGVGYWRGGRVVIPLQCRWRIDETDVLTGQAVRAVLMLHDMVEIPTIGAVPSPRVEGALVEALGEVGPFERTVVGTDAIYQLPIAAFLITPSRGGTIVLPTVGLQVGGANVVSDTTSFHVEDLPAPAGETGAVGTFQVTATLPSIDVEVGTEVAAILRIEGTGNLNYLSLPEPLYEGFVLANVDEESNYAATYNGYVGYREIRYQLVAQSEGTGSVEFPSFVWVDPVEGVQSSSAASRSIKVLPQVVRIEVEDEFPFALETATEISAHRRGFAYLDYGNYLWIVPGVLVLGILVLLKKARIILVACVALCTAAGHFEAFTEVDRAVQAYENEDYRGAADLYGRLLQKMPGNPGLLYNRSIAEYRSGNYISALHYVRLAVKRAPSSARYREFTAWMNEAAELPDVLYPALNVDPDLFFYLFIVLALASTGFAVAQTVRNRGVFFIVAVLSLVLAVSSVGMLTYIHRKNSRATGIVLEVDAPVRSIPNDTAGVRFVFNAGASLRIIDDSGGYFLVESGAGTSGWIPVETLYID